MGADGAILLPSQLTEIKLAALGAG